MSESPAPVTHAAADSAPPSTAPDNVSATAAQDGAPRPAAAPPSRWTGAWLGALALIALALLGFVAWQSYSNRQEIDDLREDLAKRLTDVDARARASSTASNQLREVTREASVRIGALEGKLAESQSQQIALESLYQELSRNRDEWAFAEIEQTLLVASQQLQLAGNVRAALIALQAANTRLQHMNRPQLLALRKAINEDIARLNAAPFVDTVGLSVRIDTLVAAVDKLPLVAESRPALEATAAADAAPAQVASAWSRFWRELWTDMRQIVRVQRIENADVALLAPAQAFFLRENLKLRLLTARMALLAHDQVTFSGDLKAARAWLARYFDGRDEAVVAAVSALASLQTSEVNIDLPDLTATLEALRLASQSSARTKQ